MHIEDGYELKLKAILDEVQAIRGLISQNEEIDHHLKKISELVEDLNLMIGDY